MRRRTFIAGLGSAAASNSFLYQISLRDTVGPVETRAGVKRLTSGLPRL